MKNPIKLKLIIICASFTLALVSSVGFGVWRLSETGKELVEIAELKIPLVKVLTQATIHQLEATISLEKYLKDHKLKDQQNIVKNAKSVTQEVKEAKDLVTNNLDLAVSEKDKAKLKSYAESISSIHTQEVKFFDKLNSLLENKGKSTAVDILILEQELEKQAISLSHQIEELILAVEDDTVQVARHAEHEELFAIKLILVLGISLISISLLLSFFIGRNMTKEVSHLNTQLNHLNDSMIDISDNLGTTSSDSLKLSTEQDASLEDTSASVEEIRMMAEKSSQQSEGVKEVTASSKENAKNSTEANEKLNGSINSIVKSQKDLIQQTEKNVQDIDGIRKLIEEISEKVQVINDIVFQTKLLSFNASVEAARAGEHGKGFAVVAEEVGSLAAVSGNAAGEINAILESSVEKVKNMTVAIKSHTESLSAEGEKNIQASLECFKENVKSIEIISKDIEKVDQMVEETVAAGREQTLGVDNINKRLHSLASTSRKSKELTNQNHLMATNLKDFVEDLSVVQKSLSALAGQKLVQSKVSNEDNLTKESQEEANLKNVA